MLIRIRNMEKMNKNPQTIYSWRAPLRPYKKRSPLIIRFYLAVIFLISTIIFFFGDKILLIPIWAVLFIFYVLTITPPPDIENKITLFGINSGDINVRWENLSFFYFKKRFGFYVLTIVSQPPYHFHLYLVVPNEKIKNKLIEILSQYLMYQDNPRKTFVDRLTDFFSNLVPDEEEEETQVVLEKLRKASL